MPDDHALLNCPFCGGDNTDTDADGRRFWVVCIDCDTPGPIRSNNHDAIAAWNYRDPSVIIPDPGNAEMVECVARAICKIRFTPDGDGCECASGGPYVNPCGCEDIARAVLVALKARLP